MAMGSRKERTVSSILGLGIIIGFILPHSNMATLLVNPLLCIVFWLLKDSKTCFRASGLFIIPLLLSLLANLLHVTSLKPVMLCVTLMMYAFVFPFSNRQISVSPIFFYVTLFIILVSQLAYILDISFITNLLDSLYPFEGERESMYSHMRSSITVDNMLNYRLGGLYRNPNDCARSITLLFVSYLILFRNKRVLPFLVLSMVGIILTGSRTGTVVGMLIIVAFVFYCRSFPTILKVLVIVATIVVTFLSASSDFVLRGLDISSGLNNSANLKWDTFLFYFQNETSLSKILIGYLDPFRFDSGGMAMSQFDADYGYLIFNYGLLGFAGILFYSMYLWGKMSKPGRVYFILLLWMITSTIFSSYRCVFEYMLLLSLVFNQNYNGKLIPKL